MLSPLEKSESTSISVSSLVGYLFLPLFLLLFLLVFFSTMSNKGPHRRIPITNNFHNHEQELEHEHEYGHVTGQEQEEKYNKSSEYVHKVPNPGLVFQILGFGFISLLVLLQFMSPTHFRHPRDPFRNWVPFEANISSSSLASTQSRYSGNVKSGHPNTRAAEDETVHIVSWMDCLDLRVLAVLMNSTLSNTRYPEQISFHFFIPGKVDDRVSFYKLKVLFPHSKLEFLGQGTVRDRIMAAHSMGEFPEWPFYEIAPFVIPAVYPALRKFVYVSPHVILKGRAEDMLRVNLQNFGVALSEDCSKRLSSYINFDVLDAIQRTAAKPWVSTASYLRNVCMPDLSLVLVDSSRLDSDLLEAILWWTRVLNKNERDGFNSAVALSVYDHYMKLKMEQRNLTQRYGDDKNIYSESCGGTIKPDLMKLLNQYLPLLSDQILANN